MHAVLQTGGKQYRVTEGDTIEIERLGTEAGQTHTFDKVLLVSSDEGVAPPADGMGDGRFVYECSLPWSEALAGQLWDLPPPESTAAAKRLGLRKPLRFQAPDVDEAMSKHGPSWLVLQVRLRCALPSFTLPRVVPAPWIAARRHWRR